MDTAWWSGDIFRSLLTSCYYNLQSLCTLQPESLQLLCGRNFHFLRRCTTVRALADPEVLQCSVAHAYSLYSRQKDTQLSHMTYFILKQSEHIVPYMCTLSLKIIARAECTCRDVKADEASHTSIAFQDLKAVL